MEQPRRVSTRYRGEPPPKRKRLTPTPPPPPSSASKSKTHHHRRSSVAQPEPKEEEMPTKVKDDKPLPTLNEPQEADLPDDVFQTISESGVLKESLERSRRKWIDGGVFERYWTKPSKRKGVPEVQQPAKETMSRLGTCSMVVGPHTFELTLYSVKEPQQPPIQFPTYPQTPQSYSQYSPYPQTGTYTSTYGPPFTGSVVPDVNPPPRLSTGPQSAPLPGFREGFKHADSQTPPVPIPPLPSPHPPPPARRLSKSSNNSNPDRRPSLSTNALTTTPNNSNNTNGGPSTDPVIQMLAQRAGQDPRLKSLMTIVAAGDASQDQLKEFQSHIDELNSLLKKQQQPTQPPQPPQQPPPPLSASTPAPTTATPVKPEPPAQTPAARQTYTIPPYTAPAPPPPRYTPAPAPAQPTGPQTLVFDFLGPGSTGDRFLFPKNSILEYQQPGNMSVLASFLAIRTGEALHASSSTNSGYYKAAKEYYEPLTIKLTASNAKVLEPVARAVRGEKEVREYMEECFKGMERGRKVWLARRLPREKRRADGEGGEEDATANGGGAGARKGRKHGGEEGKKAGGKENKAGNEWDVVRGGYEAPNSMMPL